MSWSAPDLRLDVPPTAAASPGQLFALDDGHPDLRAREVLAALTRELYARGWMPGTSGNHSVRASSGGFWVTASGRAKGTLTARDLVEVGLDGHPLRPDDDAVHGLRPSAETSIHAALYAIAPDAGCALHVHTPAANLVTRWRGGAPDAFTLPPLELVKGLGVWDFEPRISVAIVDNPVDVPRIGAALRVRFRARPPLLPAALIRDHGLTVWGATPQQALDRLESLVYLLDYAVAAWQAGAVWWDDRFVDPTGA